MLAELLRLIKTSRMILATKKIPSAVRLLCLPPFFRLILETIVATSGTMIEIQRAVNVNEPALFASVRAVSEFRASGKCQALRALGQQRPLRGRPKRWADTLA